MGGRGLILLACPRDVILQELKKKKGIKDEVQLTSKQKETIQIQLDKEASVRRRLQGVWKQRV